MHLSSRLAQSFVTVSIALSVPLCLLALAFAVQALVLPRPDRGAAIARNALDQLYLNPSSRSRTWLNGRRATTACLPAQERIPGTPYHRPAQLIRSSQGWIRKVTRDPRRWPVVAARSRNGRRQLKYLLAGCPGQMASLLARTVQSSDSIVTDAVSGPRRLPVYRFDLKPFHQLRISLYVRRSDARPFLLTVRGAGLKGTGAFVIEPLPRRGWPRD